MTGRITVVGLGPGSFDRIDPGIRELLLDPEQRVIARTLEHPAARELAVLRTVDSADTLFDSSETFEEVYEGLAKWAVGAARRGDDVVVAVPGSPYVAERTIKLLRTEANRADIEIEVRGGASFLDALFDELHLDPFERGLQLLDGRNLPDPLPMGLPTVIVRVDTPSVLAEVASRLDRVLPEGTPVHVLGDLGTEQSSVETVDVAQLLQADTSSLTALYLDPPAAGWTGLVEVMRQLRRECPWDMEQTHESLASHTVEETYELVEALAALDPQAGAGDAGYDEVEEELGDVLLQVVFHTVLAEERGAFTIDDVVESLRAKLVRRHPHVFGDVVVESAEQGLASWERIKAAEKGEGGSALAGVPEGLPALQRADKLQRRAARVGFDWPEAEPILDKIAEELRELTEALEDPDSREHELGDLLFAVVNLARHIAVDPEVALRRSSIRFTDRFRHMEAAADLEGLTLGQLDQLWEEAKKMSGPPPAT